MYNETRGLVNNAVMHKKSDGQVKVVGFLYLQIG